MVGRIFRRSVTIFVFLFVGVNGVARGNSGIAQPKFRNLSTVSPESVSAQDVRGVGVKRATGDFLRQQLVCHLEEVLKLKSKSLRAEIQLPTLVLDTETQLSDFQKDIGEQWGMKPDVVTNAFAAKANKIYLIEDRTYYQRLGRFIQDSLAHELVHFIQVQYQGIPVAELGEFEELEAVELQTQFREKFFEVLKDERSICPEKKP